MRGPIHDMREMIDTKGRLTKPELLETPMAIPDMLVNTIGNERLQLKDVRSTLLCVSSSALGFESIGAVIKVAEEKPVINIHLLQGLLRYSLFYYPLKRHLLLSPHTSAILKGPQDALRELGVLNTYGGYAFWISKKGNITWRSSGGLHAQELEAFRQLISHN